MGKRNHLPTKTMAFDATRVLKQECLANPLFSNRMQDDRGHQTVTLITQILG